MSSAAASKVPKVVSDPRFRAGRRLLTDAKQGEAAVEVFGSLLQEARSTYGPESVETAPAYYEYGNALFRLYESSRVVDEENDKEDKQDEDDTAPPNKVKVASAQSISSNDEGRMDSALKKRREAAAAAAEKRFQKPHYSTNHDDDDDEDKKPAAVPSQEAVSKDGGKEDESNAVPSNNSNNEDNNKSSSKEKERIVGDSEHDQGEHNEEAEAEDAEDDDDDDDDIHLSLEMMETAFSILDQYLQDNTTANKYHDWAEEQISRVLTGIGDVLSAMERHADAADAYARALQHRQDRLEQVFGQNEDKKRTVDYLHARRLIVESNVLIAQEFLACPEDEDVVTTESPTVLCRAAERVECARGYYEKTREELQETIFLMGQLTAAKAGAVAGGDNNALDKNDLAKEKEDICFVSTMVMAVGIQLAKIDEEEQQQKAATASLSQQPVKKKAKR